MTEKPKWREPYLVDNDSQWWMKLSVWNEDNPECLVKEGTVHWNADGSGHYGVFLSFEDIGLGLHCWPDFYALSDAQDFIEELLSLPIEQVRSRHGKDWHGVVR